MSEANKSNPRKKVSGPTKTYAERRESGKEPLFVWISKAALLELERLSKKLSMPKTEVIERWLTPNIWEEDRPKHKKKVPQGSSNSLPLRGDEEASGVATGEPRKD